jgi:peptidoglycan/xylan/chitin deacetylase (PgdA/CDA1 family)
MTWDQLIALDRSLITVGAHSQTHIDLPQATDARLESELCDGRRCLEEKLGRPVTHFCYPDGLYDRRSMAAVAHHYESAVTTRRGANRSGDSLLELKRIHVDYDIPRLAWAIATCR